MSASNDVPTNTDLSAGLSLLPETAPKKQVTKRAPKAPAAEQPAAAATGRTTIIISESDNPNDLSVFVSVNGYAYNIKRGVEVSVPNEVVGVLENAVESRIIKTSEGAHTLKSYLRFPFRVVN